MSSAPANARYCDPSFEEKRLWIARLLTHYLMELENTVIISIDESNFRSRLGPERRWRFDEARTMKQMRKRYAQ
jgi:hypothetical protein